MNLNAIHNVKNPFQGDARKVLCVCSAGLLRSPTAANVLHKEYGYNTRACGIHTDYALIPISELLVTWADEIVFMEDWMVTYASEMFDISDKEIRPLGVPDRFEFMEPALQKLIIERYELSRPD